MAMRPMGIGGGMASGQPPMRREEPAEQAREGMVESEAPGGPEDEDTAASPEEQAMYEAVVNAGLTIVVPEGGEEVAPPILASLKGELPDEVRQMFASAQPPIDNNPLDAAAVTGTVIVMLAEQQIEANGQQIPNDVLFHAGAEILEYIINVSDSAGIHDFQPEDVERVTYRAMDLYRTIAPRADQDALAQEFGQVVEADKAGTLGAMLPGIGNGQGG